nr:immunoglobulin heavy chain junction region [Macaca mulatta]MOX39137.1 immunoglobulin heavy chain junction region [Macaca mulatta]MOX40115.1 immunoglobulin heavy chain junction region [Macaca mulatta]MOX40721.1 immunoglobulin heavy chain junction region [Macaca mulatta]MOX41446.1 immunoglobulin heavy chain junction region [Macaca mulatta]
CARPLRPEDYW